MDGKTQLAGVMGWPVSHSRSPLLHNYWCQSYGVNGAYVPLPVPPGQVEQALSGLIASGFRGVNVTIPHKETAFQLCDQLTEMAKKAGAVNTLLFEEGRILGDCTDGAGFYANLRAHYGPHYGTALILGAGGAARAIAAALLVQKFSVMLSNRTPARAEAVVKALGGGTVVPWQEWPQRLKDVALVVNATSLGMGNVSGFDWEEAFAEGPEKLCVADTVYTPLYTPMLCAAKARGWQVVDGLGMLLHQACGGFYQWFGVMPEPDEEAFVLLRRDLGL